MKVKSQLLDAQLENRASTPTTARRGEVVINTSASNQMQYSDGSSTRTVANLDQAQTFSSKTLTSPVINTGVSGTAILDEDNMASDSATQLATQQSIKAYVDTHAADTSTHGVGVVLGSTETQNVSNKTFTDALHLTEIATPSNPSSGLKKLYPKNDGKLYTLDSSGNEAEVGSGGGGGSKNYIDSTSSNIENTVGSWLTDDGAGNAAVRLTLSVETSSPLAGIGSLKIAKSAHDATGEFIKLTTQTVDRADRGKALFGSFSYDFTDANYNSNDLILEVYDLTNAAVLYSGVSADLQILKTKGRFDFVTYTESTTASIQVRLKINSTNATAWTSLLIDEFKLGPSATVQTTYRKSQTISLTGSGNFTGGSIQVERVGNQVTVSLLTAATFASSSAPASASGLIPSWARPAITKINLSVMSGTIIVYISISDTGVLSFEFRDWAGSLSSQTTASAVNNLSYNVPEIAGPSLNDNELSLQTNRVLLQSNNSPAVSTSIAKVTYNVIESDEKGLYSSGTYTAPRSEIVNITGFANTDLESYTAGHVFFVYAYVNAVQYKIIGGQRFDATLSTRGTIAISGHLKLNKGDTLEIYMLSSVATNLSNASDINHISIVSTPDCTVLGAVRNNELINAESAGLENYVITADQWGDLDSIELPAGEWDVDIQADFYSSGATTTTNIAIGLGTTSGNTSPGATGQDRMFNSKNNTSGRYDPIGFFRKGITVTTPTTYYLKGLANGSITNLQVAYKMSARRIK